MFRLFSGASTCRSKPATRMMIRIIARVCPESLAKEDSVECFALGRKGSFSDEDWLKVAVPSRSILIEL